MPWATITQTLPRRLHSMQTLCAAICGLALVQEGADHLEQLALVDRAAAAARSRPCTWALIGVEVSSVEMYSGVA